MQFSSIEFLFLFLPLFAAVYLFLPFRFRNGWLLLGSIGFYVWGFCPSLWQTGVLAGLVLLTYLAGLLLDKKKSKLLLVICFVICVGVLAFFKLWQGGRLLPPGMSFYLFQMAAYLTEVCRGTISGERDIVRYSTHMTMFPKLLSGPLCDPADLQIQLWGRSYFSCDFRYGLQELIAGLSIKVILANRLGGLWAQAAVIGYESISVPFAWTALIAYVLRLYLDFWGYSLMAVGIGKMLGFHLPKNFHDPYCARTVSDFYRRWHASLGLWFRNYVYIPLGGSRGGMLRTTVNLAVVWFLTGLWHGIGWGYLVWAGFLWFLIVNEKLWLGKRMAKSRVLSHVYVPFVIILSWLPFALPELSQTAVYFGRLFGFAGQALDPNDFLLWGKDYFPMLLCGGVLCTPWPGKLFSRCRESFWMDLALLGLFWVCIYFISTGSQDPFLYFRF